MIISQTLGKRTRPHRTQGYDVIQVRLAGTGSSHHGQTLIGLDFGKVRVRLFWQCLPPLSGCP